METIILVSIILTQVQNVYSCFPGTYKCKMVQNFKKPLINRMYCRKALLLAILTVNGSFSLLSRTGLASALLGRMEKGLWRIASLAVVTAENLDPHVKEHHVVDAGSRIW